MRLLHRLAQPSCCDSILRSVKGVIFGKPEDETPLATPGRVTHSVAIRSLYLVLDGRQQVGSLAPNLLRRDGPIPNRANESQTGSISLVGTKNLPNKSTQIAILEIGLNSKIESHGTIPWLFVFVDPNCCAAKSNRKTT
jgi:hypothetical protein